MKIQYNDEIDDSWIFDRVINDGCKSSYSYSGIYPDPKLTIVFVYILQVTFYEGLKDLTQYGKQKWFTNSSYHVNSSLEGLLLGGLAGGKFLACAAP